jgi:hypothetical protein
VPARHDFGLDCSFKRVVVRSHYPVWVLGDVNEFGGHWITGTPELHRIIINGISAAKDLRGGIDGVPVSANDLQNGPRSHLIVTM